MTSAGRETRPVGRPPQISRDRIIEAVSSAANVDALTMRELALRLGVSHGALYRWVKDRDALFDLVSEVLVERILAVPGVGVGSGLGPGPVAGPASGVGAGSDPGAGAGAGSGAAGWRPRLESLAVGMRENFLAVPGLATHLARPHAHNAHSVDKLRAEVVDAFTAANVPADLAEQGWYIFITSVVAWLSFEENATGLGSGAPRFEIFLATLLRGLPARV